MIKINGIEKLLEYLYTLEKKASAEGYDLQSLGYSEKVQEAIDRLHDQKRT